MLEKVKAIMKKRVSVKYKIAIVAICLLMTDIFMNVNAFIINKVEERDREIVRLELIIDERDDRISSHIENENLYQDTLFEIAKKLYDREQFMTGGVEIPTEISNAVLLEAIQNASEDFRHVLLATENYFNNRDNIMSQIPSIWPLQHSKFARVTSGFGFRISPISGKIILHRGMDITGGEIDTKNKKYTAPLVIATADGRVKLHYLPPGWYNGKYYKGYIDDDGDDFGAYVVIEHGAVNDEGVFIPNGYETIYAHMANTQKYVKEGELIYQGEPVGEMGATGNTTGIHVHYELKKNRIHVDPVDYLVSMLMNYDGKEVIMEVVDTSPFTM